MALSTLISFSSIGTYSALLILLDAKSTMLNAYATIQSVGLGMLAITVVLSAMYLVKNMAERRVANTPEGDLIAKGLVKGADGRRPETIQRDLLAPVWFALFPFIAVTPGVYLLGNTQVALISGASAALLGLFTWWLIPRMPSSDLLYDAQYRITLIAIAVIVCSLGLGYMVSQNLNIPIWKDTFSGAVTIVGILVYGLYLLLGRMPRFRGEPATYVSVLGFILIFAGLIINTVA